MTTWERQCQMYPFEVRLRPGCYAGPDAPLVSRHRTLAAAVRQARRSDRWQVERSDRHGCIWAAEPRPSPYGPGLYGMPRRRGEPSLRACIAAAERAAANVCGG